MAVYRAPFPTPESRRPTWRLLRQDILFIEPPSHQPACASSMMEYTSASFVAGFLLTLLWLLSSETKKGGRYGKPGSSTGKAHRRHARSLWFPTDVFGLFSNNVGPFLRNLVLSGPLSQSHFNDSRLSQAQIQISD
jgi:hypothetical protein